MQQVHIYTDGAAKGNPGNGGYGVVMELVGTPHKKELERLLGEWKTDAEKLDKISKLSIENQLIKTDEILLK